MVERGLQSGSDTRVEIPALTETRFSAAEAPAAVVTDPPRRDARRVVSGLVWPLQAICQVASLDLRPRSHPIGLLPASGGPARRKTGCRSAWWRFGELDGIDWPAQGRGAIAQGVPPRALLERPAVPTATGW